MAAWVYLWTSASFLCLCPYADDSGGGGGDGVTCLGFGLVPHPSGTGPGRAVPDRSL